MLTSFTINIEEGVSIESYYSLVYKGYKMPGNPDFLNILKNKNNNESLEDLREAIKKVGDILLEDLPKVIVQSGLQNCVLVCVPRAKALDKYFKKQLLFRKAVRNVASEINGVIDGVDCIKRHKNTYTTHLPSDTGYKSKDGWIDCNDGKKPYPGITKDTCFIDEEMIRGKDIILIDDIYTKTIGIDEDCIRSLLESGARRVIFYAIAYTKRDLI